MVRIVSDPQNPFRLLGCIFQHAGFTVHGLGLEMKFGTVRSGPESYPYFYGVYEEMVLRIVPPVLAPGDHAPARL